MNYKRGDRVKVHFAMEPLTCKAHEDFVGHIGVVAEVDATHQDKYRDCFGREHLNPEGPIKVQFDHWVENETGTYKSQVGRFYNWQLKFLSEGHLVVDVMGRASDFNQDIYGFAEGKNNG